MAKWNVTTIEGVVQVEIGEYYFDRGPTVSDGSGSLCFEEYVNNKGMRTVAVYNKDYWLKAEIDG